MKLVHFFTFSVIFLLFSFSIHAQRPSGAGSAPNAMQSRMGNIGRIYGKIIDATTKKPVEFASVVVMRPMGKRDSLLNGALTVENGDFSVEKLPLGPLKVKVSFIGYADFQKMITLTPPENLEIDLGDIALKTDEKVLDAVEIKTERAQTQLSLDKKVFNVDKNITATGGTAEDVLKNVPAVTVDMDGTPKLRNGNALVYIDGKPSLMSINQIPADQIETVEVISNPSAKYEAASANGIINIVLKKNLKPGYNGFLALGIGTGKRYNATANINVKQGRWNMTAFYNNNSSKNPTNAYVFRSISESNKANRTFDQLTNTTFDNTFQIGKLGLDYSVDNRNTVSVSGTLVDGAFNINSIQDYAYPAVSGDGLLAKGVREVLPKNRVRNYQAQATWKKTFPKKGQELTTDVTYGWGGTKNASDWATTGFDNKGTTLKGFPELVRIGGTTQGNQLVAQIDYMNPVNDSTKMEYGARLFSSVRQPQSLYNDFNYATNQYEQNNLLSQSSTIDESIYAAYFNYGSRWKTIGYQAGMRYEQSHLKGISDFDKTTFGYDYPKGSDIMSALFPSLYLSNKFNANSEIQANFSRKIGRPNFMQIMPIIMGSDRQNIRIGNPKLQPEFINLVELNYNQLFGGNNWLVSGYFMNETNTIKPFATASPNDPNLLITSFINGKYENRYGVENTLKLALGKNVDFTTNFNLFNVAIVTETTNNSGWAYNSKANLNVKFPKNFSVQLNGNYESDRIIPQGYRKGISFMDFAVKKSFFGGAANITFSVNDVFNSRREITTYLFPTYYQENMRRRDLRFYRLSLQMPFGKMDASIFKRAKEGRKQQQGQGDMDFGG